MFAWQKLTSQLNDNQTTAKDCSIGSEKRAG